jgi:hypothetical protein
VALCCGGGDEADRFAEDAELVGTWFRGIGLDQAGELEEAVVEFLGGEGRGILSKKGWRGPEPVSARAASAAAAGRVFLSSFLTDH